MVTYSRLPRLTLRFWSFQPPLQIFLQSHANALRFSSPVGTNLVSCGYPISAHIRGKSDETDFNDRHNIAFLASDKAGPFAVMSGLRNITIEAFTLKETQQRTGQHTKWHRVDADLLEVLTPRQHQIMDMVLSGKPSKNIATELGISRRTVENHRAAIMLKTGSKSIPALARLALMCAMTTSINSDAKLKLSLA